MMEAGMADSISLDGVTMAVSVTADEGVVGAGTRIRFVQRGSRVLGRYSGGRILRGFLVGELSGASLTFRFAQVETTHDRRSALHAGHSRCEVCRSDLGTIRVIEHFSWATRDGVGTNVFDEILAP
jgi:hypothetical protein